AFGCRPSQVVIPRYSEGSRTRLTPRSLGVPRDDNSLEWRLMLSRARAQRQDQFNLAARAMQTLRDVVHRDALVGEGVDLHVARIDRLVLLRNRCRVGLRFRIRKPFQPLVRLANQLLQPRAAPVELFPDDPR